MCTEQEHGHEIYPIPVVEKGLEINGFINKNTEYIELDYGNLDYVTYLLLKRLREYINRYLPELDQVFVTCKLCGNDYTLSLPDQKAINNAIAPTSNNANINNTEDPDVVFLFSASSMSAIPKLINSQAIKNEMASCNPNTPNAPNNAQLAPASQ